MCAPVDIHAIAQGLTVTREEVTLPDMTWRRVGMQRPFAVIDERQIHYCSTFANGVAPEFIATLDGLDRTPNPLLSIVDGRAVTTGSGFISTNIHPRAPWVSCEAIIETLGESGAVGPALFNPDGYSLRATFDGATVTLRKDRGGDHAEVVATVAATLPGRLTLKLMGTTATAWLGDKCVAVLDDTFGNNPFIDWRDPATWAGFRYALHSTGAGNIVSRLRGGAAGVMGAENILTVTHADGAPYFIGRRVLVTADCHGVGRLEDWNTCLALVDLDTASVEIIGRIYFTQAFPDGARHEGGNFVRLQWHPDRQQWLITVLCFDGWASRGPMPPHGVDYFGWVDIDPHGENHIAPTQLQPLGINPEGNGFGASVRKIGGVWFAAISTSGNAADDVGLPADWSHIHPSLWSGPSLDDMALVWRADAIGKQMECGTFYRINGRYYVTFSGVHPGNAVYDLAGNYLGEMRDIPDGAAMHYGIGNPLESWREHVTRETPDGRTEHFAIGNTQEIFPGSVPGLTEGEPATIDLAARFDQDRGAFTVWRAEQTTPGREYATYRVERLIRHASIYQDAAPSLATGLRAQWGADGQDATPFRRKLLALAGGGLIATTRVFDVAGDWTATLIAQATTSTDNSALLRLAEFVELYFDAHIPRVSTFNGSAWEAVAAPSTVNDALPHRYTVRYSAGVLSLWIDGSNVAEAARAFDPAPGTVAIGCRISELYRWYAAPPVSSFHFPGTISGVQIRQRALTTAEIASL